MPQARNGGVDQIDIDALNRWRSIENEEGAKSVMRMHDQSDAQSDPEVFSCTVRAIPVLDWRLGPCNQQYHLAVNWK
jgi:hypothetical protein